jgi:hypothetical protein
MPRMSPTRRSRTGGGQNTEGEIAVSTGDWERIRNIEPVQCVSKGVLGNPTDPHTEWVYLIHLAGPRKRRFANNLESPIDRPGFDE